MKNYTIRAYPGYSTKAVEICQVDDHPEAIVKALEERKPAARSIAGLIAPRYCKVWWERNTP